MNESELNEDQIASMIHPVLNINGPGINVDILDMVFILEELAGSLKVSEEFLADPNEKRTLEELGWLEGFEADMRRIEYLLETYGPLVEDEE